MRFEIPGAADRRRKAAALALAKVRLAASRGVNIEQLLINSLKRSFSLQRGANETGIDLYARAIGTSAEHVAYMLRDLENGAHPDTHKSLGVKGKEAFLNTLGTLLFVLGEQQQVSSN